MPKSKSKLDDARNAKQATCIFLHVLPADMRHQRAGIHTSRQGHAHRMHWQLRPRLGGCRGLRERGVEVVTNFILTRHFSEFPLAEKYKAPGALKRIHLLHIPHLHAFAIGMCHQDFCFCKILKLSGCDNWVLIGLAGLTGLPINDVCGAF